MKIESKEYPFVLNINTLRKTAKKLGFDDVSFLDKIMGEMGQDVKFSHLETIANLIICGIEEGNRLNLKSNKKEVEFSLSLDDVIISLTDNPEELQGVLSGLVKDLPQTEKK